ncbi:MAG: hypothetical protein AAB483_00560 [Patescibacteria group bacterium]
MTRKIFVEVLLGIFVVTLVVSNVLLASQVVALREEVPTLLGKLAIQEQEASPLPTPAITSLLANIWTVPQAVTNTSKIQITSLTPSVGAGPVNTKVSIKGKGFTTTENTVTFGYHKISGLKAKAGVIEFIVPSYLVYPCVAGQPCPTENAQKVLPGPYSVSVSNKSSTSKPATFLVTEF